MSRLQFDAADALVGVPTSATAVADRYDPHASALHCGFGGRSRSADMDQFDARAPRTTVILDNREERAGSASLKSQHPQ